MSTLPPINSPANVPVATIFKGLDGTFYILTDMEFAATPLGHKLANAVRAQNEGTLKPDPVDIEDDGEYDFDGDDD